MHLSLPVLPLLGCGGGGWGWGVRNEDPHPTLTSEERDSLEGLINIQELSIAVKNLNNDKSPGSDGYSAECLKLFFKDVGMFLLRLINCGFEKGEMSITLKQGVIRCIPKEGKDKIFLKSWRPVTPLNKPYKIASSCIAQRLKSVLPMFICMKIRKDFLIPSLPQPVKFAG